MSIEITLLKALSKKENLLKYKYLINPKSLSSQSQVILKDYEVYFDVHKDAEEIQDFASFFFQVRHPYLDEASQVEYKEIFRLLNNVEIEEQVPTLLIGFEQQELYTQLHRDLDSNLEVDKLVDKIENFKSYVDKIYKDKDQDTEQMDLNAALTDVDRSSGLVWRNEALKSHFGGGLIRGDFGIVAGYTDTGKTSFLASELSFMAQQLKGDQYILWLNNEGDWKRILPRVYSAALGCSEYDLLRHKNKAIDKYKELMNGDLNRIKIMDIQGKHVKDIERLVKSNPPSLIVFDMLDHLRGFERAMSSEGSHERYGMLYQWAREFSSQYCPIIATSQLNREGSNCMYPDITNMKGSGVDKQAAAVYVLMIGALQGEDNIRYLSTPKFKLGPNKSWKTAVKFDSIRSRFV